MNTVTLPSFSDDLNPVFAISHYQRWKRELTHWERLVFETTGELACIVELQHKYADAVASPKVLEALEVMENSLRGYLAVWKSNANEARKQAQLFWWSMDEDQRLTFAKRI